MNQTKGTIYKITNLINGKVYIGQTKQPYQSRFIQHKSHARTGCSHHKLARAFRKYGDDNFIIEPIEECLIEKLDEREAYWIKFYQSTLDEYGYNIIDGGQSNKNYIILENEDEILDYYYSCHNQAKTCQHFNITDYKLRQLLTRRNLPTDKTNYGKHTRERVKIIELDKEFDSGVECAQFFIDNNICQSKKIECVQIRLSKAINNNKKIYGYTVIKTGLTQKHGRRTL